MNDRRTVMVLSLIFIIVLVFTLTTPYKTEISNLSDQQFYTELVSLDGIGPILAEKIVNYRHKKPYVTPDEYIAVKGIGEEKTKLIKSKFK